MTSRQEIEEKLKGLPPASFVVPEWAPLKLLKGMKVPLPKVTLPAIPTVAAVAIGRRSANRQRQALRLRLVAILKVLYLQRAAMQDEMQRLIASMTPQMTVPQPAQVLQARRNAVARDALLREFGALTSADIGKLAGSKSPNRAALAHRWKSDGRIFAVAHHGTNYFPGFQFTAEGQPLQVIGEIVGLLGERLTTWELALWFTSGNGWLGGMRPVDLLSTEPAKVVAAAERECEGNVF